MQQPRLIFVFHLEFLVYSFLLSQLGIEEHASSKRMTRLADGFTTFFFTASGLSVFDSEKKTTGRPSDPVWQAAVDSSVL